MNIDNLMKRAQRFEADGNYKQAVEYYNKVLDLDINQLEAQNCINRIMKEISEEHNLPFYDIDAIMMKSKYWHVDFIHYIPESNSFVAEYLCRLLV